MKKLFAVILALGLIVAVSGTASAVDVSVSGSYYVVGVYDDNPSLKDSNVAYSRAYMFQGIRLEPVFKIADGLTFTARMDAMEGQWDVNRSKLNAGKNTTVTGTVTHTDGTTSTITSTGGSSFDWERGYVTFNTGIGKFDVGYQSAGAFGLDWADSTTTRPRVKLTSKVGPVILIGIFEKWTENTGLNLVDADMDAYYLAPIYRFKGGETGVLYGYIATNTTRPTLGYRMAKQILYPYFKATVGSFLLEGELDYIFGKAKEYDGAGTNVDYDGWGAFLRGTTNFGPAKVGIQLGWSKGDDPATADKDESGPTKGADWNPALILVNDDLFTWSGAADNNTRGHDGNPALSGNNNGLQIINLFADYKLTPKMSLGGAFTYAKADKVPANWDKAYGTEIDVTASYKLYDNLTYMVGAGYLWTGDYYKQGNAATKVDDDYILMNKLTLSF